MKQKLISTPVEFLALNEGDVDGKPIVILSFRGLQPDNPMAPTNIDLQVINAEKLTSDLKDVIEKLRRMRVAASGPCINSPLNTRRSEKSDE